MERNQTLDVFGCLAYMKLPSIHTTKPSDRSKHVINLGKEPEMKAYRVYDPENKGVHVSQDVFLKKTRNRNDEKTQVYK